MRGQELLEVADRVGAVMENGSGKRCISVVKDVQEILGFPGAARYQYGPDSAAGRAMAALSLVASSCSQWGRLQTYRTLWTLSST